MLVATQRQLASLAILFPLGAVWPEATFRSHDSASAWCAPPNKEEIKNSGLHGVQGLRRPFQREQGDKVLQTLWGKEWDSSQCRVGRV